MILLEPEAAIGVGSETVYVYFAASERRLAHLEGRDFWPCKVGRSRQDVSKRILQQRPFTAMAVLPVVGLVIRTDNAVALESKVHRTLRYLGLGIKAPRAGRDWFYTSPSQVIDVYEGRVAIPAAPPKQPKPPKPQRPPRIRHDSWNPPKSGMLGELYSEILRFLNETGMSPSAFGEKATGNRALMHYIQHGGDLQSATYDKARAYINRHSGQGWAQPTPS